jgi:hypothetical protein
VSEVGAGFVTNTCVALFVVTLVAFVCNLVASSPTFARNSRAIKSPESWDNNRVKYITKED